MCVACRGYGRKTEGGLRCGPPQQDVWSQNSARTAQGIPHARPRGTHPMSSTLEVSVKLSGWLNALASKNIYLHQAAGADVCVRRVQVLWPEDRGRDALWTTTRQVLCTVRTPPQGTYHMEVTFEVSVKLSGWLNAVAP